MKNTAPAGSGYHDHNWGDVPMQTLMHNWYWARASVGPYSIIASHITATPAYGYETQIVYMLARDGKIIADDDAKVAFETRSGCNRRQDRQAGSRRHALHLSRCRYALCRVVRARENHSAGDFHRPGAVA